MSRPVYFVWLSLSLGLLAAPASVAQNADWHGQKAPSPDDDAAFVIGNTLFTVYHELGHALIDLLSLPVIGREEDAVDGFAAVTMIPDRPDAVRDALIVAVADAWRAQSDLASEAGPRLYWGVHALDQQRHFTIVCLMVGSDQEGFYDYALEAGLPEERIRSCVHDFESMRGGWRRLLDPHRPNGEAASASVSTPAPPITLAFDQPSPGLERAFDLVRETALLEDDLARFGSDIALPKPVIVRFANCGEANAYWSRSRSEVTICYELVDEYDAILLDATVR